MLELIYHLIFNGRWRHLWNTVSCVSRMHTPCEQKRQLSFVPSVISRVCRQQTALEDSQIVSCQSPGQTQISQTQGSSPWHTYSKCRYHLVLLVSTYCKQSLATSAKMLVLWLCLKRVMCCCSFSAPKSLVFHEYP